jgi:hypothetical protein
MTYKFQISILTIIICLTDVTISCGQVEQTNRIKIDTSKTAIIQFNPKSIYPFDSTFQQSELTQGEVNVIDSLLIACIKDYNSRLDKKHKQWTIDPKKYNYRKQLIVVENIKGEKEVWVNCFCNTWGNDNWKREVLNVHDGGQCYFNFKINLTAKRFYNLIVNGVA